MTHKPGIHLGLERPLHPLLEHACLVLDPTSPRARGTTGTACPEITDGTLVLREQAFTKTTGFCPKILPHGLAHTQDTRLCCAGPFAPWGRSSGIPAEPTEHGWVAQGEAVWRGEKGKGCTPLGRHLTGQEPGEQPAPSRRCEVWDQAAHAPSPVLCPVCHAPAPPRTLLLWAAERLGSATRMFGHGCPGTFGAAGRGAVCLAPHPEQIWL